MQTDAGQSQSIEIVFTPEFKRNLRQLAKKYRRIKSDVQPLLDSLAQGETPGDQIPGVQYTVYKVRAKNSDSRKGKTGGYRLIYQRASAHLIILITIYSKTEQADIAAHEIRQIILDYEAQTVEQAENMSEGISPDQTRREPR